MAMMVINPISSQLSSFSGLFAQCVQSNDGTKLNGSPNLLNGHHSTAEQIADLIKDRDLLRKEMKELENGYSGLFKRYEKLREDCVLLKNNEEELQNKVEEERSKYDSLYRHFLDLRQNAAEQLAK